MSAGTNKRIMDGSYTFVCAIVIMDDIFVPFACVVVCHVLCSANNGCLFCAMFLCSTNNGWLLRAMFCAVPIMDGSYVPCFVQYL